ncbi:dynamin protein dnm1 [Ceraceosorus bombacis]|uniref:dynamin GTPase n=1 Tax=Ceraceosorus bombacis TaxID=401625 RepID=A0A0P1BBK4_9BASI|nr:dynamin protein dnm1 [Ceraceosorus bombacis]
MDTDLIKVVNKLQETFSTIGGDAVDLPQCVVVGAQSSGKSSVLETLVGKDFLPRGQGIVTRRPLVLQLVHQPSSTNADGEFAGTSTAAPGPGPSSYDEYGEFLHLDKRFTDFSEVRREIENETYRVAGQNKGISKLPIHLKIYSPHVLNLTLVDLPGLTKIPVGDQPTNIERQIQDLVTSYISKPNCIIIAISPANVDLANSDSLKLARSVDPRGLRTIGVLTKLDLMDNGTHALDVLTGRVYPLKLGFVGIVNRSQQDINGNVSMLAARRAEEEFFKSHNAYKNISHRCGTKYLAKTLNQVLMAHIRDKLPDMKARLNTLMGQTQQELASFGDTAFLGDAHRGTLILKLMTQFARDFVASIEGTTFDISTKELCGGARVYYIFNDVFGHALDSINPTQNLTVTDIRTAIRNATGPRPSLFVPEAAFELLIKPQIKLLEPPSLRCVELVYEELMKICHNCTSTELQRFPKLHAQLIETVSELLRERLGPTSEYVQSLIAIQAAYINTNHPAFVQDSANIARSTREGHRQPAPAIAAGSETSSTAGVFEEDADDDDGPSRGPNGLAGGAKNRSDTRATSSSYGDSNGRNQLSAAHASTIGHASSGAFSRTGRAADGASATGPAGGRDFLNYFFGGASGMPGSASGPVAAGPQSQRGAFSEYGRDQKSNPMLGRSDLEGRSAAFDMKSLEKHIEATPASDEFRLSEREVLETSLIRSLIASYFTIVRQSIQDLVPKAVMHLLVNFSRDGVQARLISRLYKESLFSDLLEEDEATNNERRRVQALLEAYREAHQILSEVTFKP